MSARDPCGRNSPRVKTLSIATRQILHRKCGAPSANLHWGANMRKSSILICLMPLLVLGCGEQSSAPPRRDAQVISPPLGVPADATLVTGAERLKAMLVGKKMQAVHRETSKDQGVEYFQSSTSLLKECVSFALSCEMGGAIAIGTIWYRDSYCIDVYGSKRCSQLWIDRSGQIFVRHRYLKGYETVAYQVEIRSMDAKNAVKSGVGLR